MLRRRFPDLEVDTLMLGSVEKAAGRVTNDPNLIIRGEEKKVCHHSLHTCTRVDVWCGNRLALMSVRAVLVHQGLELILAMHDTNIAHSYDVLSSLYNIGLRLSNWT